LLEAGAVKVYAAASHPVLSGPAIERISNSKLQEVIVTDSIPLREDAQRLERLGKIKVLSVAGLLGATIESIHMETSVSSLFS
jgi:ribose-phosphate pyrophosphokinase